MVDYKGTKSDMICLPPGKTGNPLCIQDGKQCSRVNLSQFLLKAASTTSSFSLNRQRLLLNQHYRPSHTILGSVPPPPPFLIYILVFVPSELAYYITKSPSPSALTQNVTKLLQSSQVKRTPQDSINGFITRKLNPLVIEDFRFISTFLQA